MNNWRLSWVSRGELQLGSLDAGISVLMERHIDMHMIRQDANFDIIHRYTSRLGYLPVIPRWAGMSMRASPARLAYTRWEIQRTLSR